MFAVRCVFRVERWLTLAVNERESVYASYLTHLCHYNTLDCIDAYCV